MSTAIHSAIKIKKLKSKENRKADHSDDCEMRVVYYRDHDGVARYQNQCKVLGRWWNLPPHFSAYLPLIHGTLDDL